MICNVVIWRRSLWKSKCTYMICTFPQILFYSSTTRQEFGRQFEEIAAESLRKFSFDVAVCGGPKDRGIDFKGFWRLKSMSVPIIGQCRRYKRRLGPKHVRELEGTLTHEVNGTLGIIVSESGWVTEWSRLFYLTSISFYKWVSLGADSKVSSDGGGQRVDFDLWRFADHEGYEQNWAISKGGTGSIYFILCYFRGHVNCQFTSSAEG